MSFFSSLSRMFASLFGIAEGKTERATDAFVTGSPDTIRAQFRKTREDWTRDYSQMREAVADLIRIREMKMDEVKKLTRESDDIEQKMAGAIQLYKKSPDERFREAYGSLASKNEETELRIKDLLAEIDEQQKNIERFKIRLTELQRQIEAIGKEESETVADIVSSQKIRELNDRLSGLSTDTQSKNLEAIRQARQKAKAVAKLSSELSGTDKNVFDETLKIAGAGSKHGLAFDDAVSAGAGNAGAGKVKAHAEAFDALPQASTLNSPIVQRDAVEADIERLLQGTSLRPKT